MVLQKGHSCCHKLSNLTAEHVQRQAWVGDTTQAVSREVLVRIFAVKDMSGCAEHLGAACVARKARRVRRTIYWGCAGKSMARYDALDLMAHFFGGDKLTTRYVARHV
jgi:hypothetical protein